jgi:tRNA G18 (ribose-2'-O)-methylase SpoU
VIAVSDPADPRLADYVRLTDLALRTRSEVADGLFLAEGELVITRALAAGHRPRSFLLADNRWELLGPDLRERLVASGAPLYVGPHPVLEQVTGYHVHRGSLGSFHRPPPADPAGVLAGARRVVVLEEVNNHTNVGAVVRGAAALGVDALLLDPRSADPLYRRAVRVSMGSVFALPWARLEPWPAALRLVVDAGFRLLALTPDPRAASLREVAVGPDERVAVLLGAEGPGLTAGALAVAAERVRIPMSAGVDSLNVAAAAAVACYALA